MFRMITRGDAQCEKPFWGEGEKKYGISVRFIQDIFLFAYYLLMSSQGEAAKVKACVIIFILFWYIWNGNLTHNVTKCILFYMIYHQYWVNVFVQFVEDHHPLVGATIIKLQFSNPWTKRKGYVTFRVKKHPIPKI